MPDDYKYWAFVSYSDHNAKWAEWLHKLFETYRVPRRLVGKLGRLITIPIWLYPVFRDQDELPGCADLGVRVHQSSVELIVSKPPFRLFQVWQLTRTR